MHAYTVDYRQRDVACRSGGWVSRGFWLFGISRPLIACRLFGHKPRLAAGRAGDGTFMTDRFGT